MRNQNWLWDLRVFVLELLRDAVGLAGRHRVKLMVGGAMVLAGVLFLLPWDDALHAAVMHERPLHWARLARFGREWGKFFDTVVLCGGLALLGGVFRRPKWRRAALAAFLAASCAGLTANVLRVTVGRPRPHMTQPLRFRGLSFHNRYQSFPSGHSATSAGYAVAMAVAAPPFALPAVLSGGLVVWGSFYAGSHYLSDVLAGTALGTTAGLLLGAAARRKKRCWKKRLAASGPV